MIAYRRKARQWIKPPIGSQVDWSHPLAAGLFACWLLNEGAGPRATDIVNLATLTLAGGATWSNGRLSTAGASNTAQDVAPNGLLWSAWPITLVWQGLATASNPGTTGIFGIGATSGSSALALFRTSSQTIQIAANMGGTNQGAASASTLTTGVTTQLACRLAPASSSPNPSNMQLSVNGVPTHAVNPGSNSAPSWTVGTSRVWIGDYWGSGGSTPCTLNDFGLFYSRWLPDAQLAWLTAEPYAYILAPMSTRHVFLSAPAAPLFQPATLSLGAGGPFFQSGVNS